ncbi:diguanylate cyclase [Skermania piniformis]
MTMRARPLPAWVVAVPAVVTVVALVVHLCAQSRGVTTAATISVIGVSVASVIFGMVHYRPKARVGWMFSIAALLLCLAGYLARGQTQLFELQDSPVPDILTASAYAALFGSLIGFVRPHRCGWTADHFLDIALVAVCGLLASWTMLSWPVLANAAQVGPNEVVMAVYPMLDTVLVAVLMHWMLTREPQGIALTMVETGVGMVILCDLAVSLDTAGLTRLGDRYALVPFFIGLGLFGVAALHPTMVKIGAHVDYLERSRHRAIVIGVVLIVAAAVPPVRLSADGFDRWVIAGLLALLLLTLLARSERSRQREIRAQHLADHDALTGLPNRSALLRSLSAQPATVSVLFIDLDDFKAVNDRYGHEAGDDLLVEVGARLRASLRRSDTLGRYGGDEFVVVAPVDRADALVLADRMRAQLAAPFVLRDGSRLAVSASIGIATSAAGLTRDNLVRYADRAMYAVKASRRAGVAAYDLERYPDRSGPTWVSIG